MYREPLAYFNYYLNAPGFLCHKPRVKIYEIDVLRDSLTHLTVSFCFKCGIWKRINMEILI